ncbi:MAG: gamma-glutamyltransferase family protein [Hyphomicrobiales bacterium]
MRNFHLPGRSPAYATQAMAATSTLPSTLAAVEVMKAGGNAVDAAVTASAVLCVSEPHMTGIGGDCFAIVGLPDGTVRGLNGSGRCSTRADADWLKASGLSSIPDHHVHAVTVPGAIDAWDRLLRAHGTMTLGDALQPAIRLAEQGCPVSDRTAHDWALQVERLRADEGASRHLLKGGNAPKPGDVMRYPALAETLRTIARSGRDAFYAGALADDMLATVSARGSLLTREDFAATEATWVEPIATAFAGRDVLEIPPNGQGITALIALNVLKRFDLARFAPESVERRHLETEAMKLAWVLRNRHVAEAGHMDIAVDDLLSDRTADRLASEIRLDRAITDPAARVPKRLSDTIYLCVVDQSGLAVSFINSIYDHFGVGIVTPKTGITLQNRGSCFVTDTTHPNCIAPGKRPLHTIIPAMVTQDGAVAMPFGVMGGDYQPTGHVAMALNMFVYGMDPQASIDLPRTLDENGVLGIEEGVPDSVAAGLAALGHTVVRRPDALGGAQIISIDRSRGVLVGGSDSRKDGCAMGF